MALNGSEDIKDNSIGSELSSSVFSWHTLSTGLPNFQKNVLSITNEY